MGITILSELFCLGVGLNFTDDGLFEVLTEAFALGLFKSTSTGLLTPFPGVVDLAEKSDFAGEATAG